MTLQVDLLRSTFDLVLEREPEIVPRFYEILFGRYPALKQLFHRRDPAHQAQMLATALVSVIDHLDDAPWLATTLRGLGVKHVEYGVTPEMYPQVSECLRAAMAEAAGDDWTDEVDNAWDDALTAVSDLMLTGYGEEAGGAVA